MKFIICAPPYKTNSVGLVVLHVLARLLRTEGEEAVVYDSVNGLQPADQMTPEGVPYLSAAAESDDIVILPEVLTDDWWQASAQAPLRRVKRRVWYLLNRPIFLNEKPLAYQLQDYLLSYADFIDDTVPTLPIVLSQPHLFHPPAKPKRGNVAALYYGKWVTQQEVPALQEFLSQFSVVHVITRTWPADRKELAALLQEASVLITFDCLTGMIGEALACDTPVLMMEDHFQLQQYGLFAIRDCGIFRQPHEFLQARQEAPTFAPRLAQVVAGNDQRVRTFVREVKAHFEFLEASLPTNPELKEQREHWRATRQQFDLLRYKVFHLAARFGNIPNEPASFAPSLRPVKVGTRQFSLAWGDRDEAPLELDFEGSNRVREVIFGPLKNLAWPAPSPLTLAWAAEATWLDLHAIKLCDVAGTILAQWPGEDLRLELGEGVSALPGGKSLLQWRLLGGTQPPRIFIHPAQLGSAAGEVAAISFQVRAPAAPDCLPQLAAELHHLRGKDATLWRSKPAQLWAAAFNLADEKLEELHKRALTCYLLPLGTFPELALALTAATSSEEHGAPDVSCRAWRNAAELAVTLLQRVRQSTFGSCFVHAHLVAKCHSKLTQANALVAS